MYIADNMTLKWTCNENGTEDKFCIHIQQDNSGDDNPRYWSTDTHMMCWVKNYVLGDENEFARPEDWWQYVVKVCVPDSDTLRYFLDAKPLDKYKAVPDPKHDGNYLILEYWEGTDTDIFEPNWYIKYENVSESEFNGWAFDLLTIHDCMQLLEPYAVWLPVWAYIHSGITVSTGERGYPYCDEWDSGQAGWILMTKNAAIATFRDYDWKQKAIDQMKNEVAEYDQYLQGEIYGFTLYKWDDTTQQWEDCDCSDWGFVGADPIKSGMAENVGLGLKKSIESGTIEEGTAKRHVSVTYTF